MSEAAVAAGRAGIAFIEGIEVSARWDEFDVHVLGYSRHFRRGVLRERLAGTQRGYQDRIRNMVRLCQSAGYKKVSWAAIRRFRARLEGAVYVSYDVARQLTQQHGLSLEQARQLTTAGGACYVPNGAWALSLAEAAEVLHAAGAVAVLAHPGLVALDAGEAVMRRLVVSLPAANIDGIEVYHPYHSKAVVSQLALAAQQHTLLVTGGSDWHGYKRYAKSDEAFGRVGLAPDEWHRLLAATSAANF
ncbi:MAG: hypothetical protein HY372_01645 [Candidatus Andersenbacteria bacterium]|nr:hypothetical protein [Candidatus Andersenbacteria bacterium]